MFNDLALSVDAQQNNDTPIISDTFWSKVLAETIINRKNVKLKQHKQQYCHSLGQTKKNNGRKIKAIR
jgi:hypothetical protein